ncbi:MAG: T9SS type A sorting domain-containing protein [Bacteroidales bacterium]|nr:T9SS type A sorting domain-containing protein [Bacteroidales bacterium]
MGCIGCNFVEEEYFVFRFTTPTPQPTVYELPIEGYGAGNPGGYYLIASPVTVAPADVAGDPQGMTAGNFDLYYFDNSKEDEWINYKNEDGSVNTNFGNITPGKGYLYAREESTELQFSGELYDGDGQFNLAYSTGNPSADMRGWNLVGNPFTYGATVDKDAFYVMNEEGRNDIIVSEETAIAPMQGIFVLATAEGQTVKFTQALQPLDSKVVLNLNRNRGTVIDRAIVRLGEGGTLPKFMLNPENTKIYIEQGGDDYAMVSSNEDEIPVSFKAASNGTYTLNVAVQNADLDYLHLIDNLAGTDTDLLANPNYTFEAHTGDYASRFTLVLRNTTGLVEHFAFFNGHNWTVSNQGEATLQVIDVTGRLVSTKTIDGTTQLDINAAAGVYMFRLVNGSDVKVQKVIVR